MQCSPQASTVRLCTRILDAAIQQPSNNRNPQSTRGKMIFCRGEKRSILNDKNGFCYQNLSQKILETEASNTNLIQWQNNYKLSPNIFGDKIW